MLKQPKIVLASASPRRRELLSALGLEFEIHPSHINEDPLEGETPLETQIRVTLAKARATNSDANLEQIIIACDTTVLLNGEMLNKPLNEEDAWSMLRRLRNQVHEVQSCIVVKRGEEESVDVVTSQVLMRDYTDEEIASYIASGDPFDKAGSYAVQHEAFHPVAEIRGCPLNVIGLALCRLRERVHELPDCAQTCASYFGEPCPTQLDISSHSVSGRKP
jgi:MAF protein